MEKENIYLLSEDGYPYYETIPEDFEVAKSDDFYTEKGKLILKKAFLVHSEKYPNRYWAYRVKESFPYPGSDFNYFLEKGRVYIYKKPE